MNRDNLVGIITAWKMVNTDGTILGMNKRYGVGFLINTDNVLLMELIMENPWNLF